MDGSEADLGVIDLILPDGEGTDLIEELRNQPGLRGARPDREPGENGTRQGGRGRGGRHPAQVSPDVDTILDATRRIGEGETLLSEDELISLLRLAGQTGKKR